MAKLGNMLFSRTQDEEGHAGASAGAEVKPADVSKLYKKLLEPGGSPGDVIAQLEAKKRFLRPEEIINHSLKLDSEYAIMLLQLVVVARFLDDSNKVVILEALKTLGRIQIDFDASVLLPYTEIMTGIELEQVMAIIEKQADADLVPHLSAYLTTKNEELNDYFAQVVATKTDRGNFQKFRSSFSA